jgi:hypothetical protein
LTVFLLAYPAACCNLLTVDRAVINVAVRFAANMCGECKET